MNILMEEWLIVISYDYSAIITEKTAEKYIHNAETFINEAETLL